MLTLLAVACGDAGSTTASTAPAGIGSAALAGRWVFQGEGYVPEGQDRDHSISRTYTFLTEGTYVLETTSQERGSFSSTSASGKWDVHPDSIVLVQQRRQYGGSNIEDTKVVTSKFDAKLSADGKELTLHGEDGDCPGSDCTRAYKKK